MKKLIIAFIIVVLIVGGFFYFVNPAEAHWEDGAPTMDITMEIKKVSAETGAETASATTELQIDEETKPDNSWQGTPATLVEVGIPFVEPTSKYIIEWSIEAEATPQSPAVTSVHGTCSIFGSSGSLDYIGAKTTSTQKTITSFFGNWDVSVPHTFGFPESTAPDQFFDRLGDANTPILGKDLHNSEFNITLNVVASNDPAIFGTTSVDIIIQVGSGGTIEVKILGITAIVTEV